MGPWPYLLCFFCVSGFFAVVFWPLSEALCFAWGLRSFALSASPGGNLSPPPRDACGGLGGRAGTVAAPRKGRPARWSGQRGVIDEYGASKGVAATYAAPGTPRGGPQTQQVVIQVFKLKPIAPPTFVSSRPVLPGSAGHPRTQGPAVAANRPGEARGNPASAGDSAGAELRRWDDRGRRR